MDPVTFEALSEALTDSDFAPSSTSTEDRIIVTVSEAEGEDALSQIKCIAADYDCQATWTGNSNTDSDGETTLDILIELA